MNTKQFSKLTAIVGLLMAGSLMFTANSANAQTTYQEHGNIFRIGKTALSTGDGAVALSPTVKVMRKDGTAGSIRDVKPGDEAEITYIRLNERVLVDKIQLLP
jgi:hypothetical protein